jgi:Na+/melibiose symporter-like transporter
MRLPAYRRLFGAYSVNNLGDWIGEIALSVLVLRATDSVLAVTALWVLGRFVPGLLAPLSVAWLERRFGAARVLPGLHVLEAALFAALAAAAATAAPLPLILALALVDGIVASSARALVRTAVVAATRPHGLLREGNALLGVAFTTTIAAGPLLGGAVVALFGVPAALILDAASFAIAAIALLPLARRQAATEEPDDAPATQRLRAGFAHLWRHRELRVLVLADSAAGVFFAAIIPVELVFVTQTLGGSEADFGVVLAAWGLGAVLGSAAVSAFPGLGPRTLLGTGVALLIASYLGMATAAGVTAVVAWSLLGGVGNGLEGVVLTTFIQERTPAVLQARINGVIEALHTASPGFGFLVGGAIAAAASPRAAYWVAGLGALAVTLVAVAALRRPPPRAAPAYA